MSLLFILFLVALAVSSIGFKKYIWFMSIGYGFSIAAIGVALLIAGGARDGAAVVCACILLILYGVRLGGYLAFRDLRSGSYNAKMKKEYKDGFKMPMPAKCGMWASVALLYMAQTAPLAFRVMDGKGADAALIIGIIISIIGLAVETLADVQKTIAKRKNPRRFVDTGLYSIVRCPNYFGELLFWTGVFIGGLPVYHGALRWIVALIGFVGIIYVMFSVTRRLELRQNRTYGKLAVYKRYVRTTPILIPLVPLYSVTKYRWLVV